MAEEHTRRVYSTDGEHAVDTRTREKPARPASKAASGRGPQRPVVPSDGWVRVHRTKSGRGGKTVTAITGLPGGERALDDLLKLLKQHCGAGGTREGDVLEIQGDHRERVRAKLEALGHRVKMAGG